MTPSDDVSVHLTPAELRRLCAAAILRAGASAAQAEVLADATVQAEDRGKPAVGLAHLFDYLDGFERGRIAGDAAPEATSPGSVVVSVDCHRGLAQHGFQVALPGFLEAARSHGLAAMGLHRCFTAGEIAFYVSRLADEGLVGVAAANSPALMAVAGSRGPVLGTNPLAYAVPLADGRRVLVDQATSATAFVLVRAALDEGRLLAEGVAVDVDGQPTTSPADALQGALLPFGGYKGGNVALLVELLALLAGGEPSVDAAPFERGADSPEVGVFVLAIDPASLQPGYAQRVTAVIDRWEQEYGAAIRLRPASDPGGAHHRMLSVPAALLERLLGAT